MDFIENLFVDEAIKDINTIVYSLKNGIGVYNIYIIGVYWQGKNTAQIISSIQYFKEINRGQNLKVIGVARGKNGANKLFAEILQYWSDQGFLFETFKENIVKE